MRAQRLRRTPRSAPAQAGRKLRRSAGKAVARPAYLQGKAMEDDTQRLAETPSSTQAAPGQKPASGGGPMPKADPSQAVSDELEQQITARQGLGAPLPEQVRHEMQKALGHDFSAVRIHTDEAADRLAQRLQARAFTVGNDIFFAAGQYAPETEAGRRLLIHELTHVVQGESAQLPAGAAHPLRRDWWRDFTGRVNDWLVGDPCLSAFHEAERWARNGPYPTAPQSIIGAGGRGGFDAQYRPDPVHGDGELAVSQGVAVEFKDTFVESGGTITPHPDLPASAKANARAATIDAIADPAERAAALAAYQWQPAERAPWVTRLEPLVEDSWGGRYPFFLNQPRWDWLGASVALDLDVGERPQRATDHMYLETYKTPPAQSLRSFGISHSVRHGSAANARDQRMRLASTTLGPKEYDLLRHRVYFATGADVLDADARRELDRFMSRFRSADAHAAHEEIRVDVIGHASAIGGEIQNQRLSARRIRAVVAYLRRKGFPNVDSRIHPDPRGEREADQGSPDRAEDRRVDLVVDGGARQITVLHEWGHALGLGDEYPGSGRPVGSDAAHHSLAQAMTLPDGSHLPGATVERTGGIMSSGNAIRPRHYATFHHALETVTGKSPWALGLHKRKWQVGMECGQPSPPGDWHLPGDHGDNRTV